MRTPRRDPKGHRSQARPLAAAIIACLPLAACGPSAETAATGSESGAAAWPAARPVVYTTFYPTAYFAGRIAGDLASVVCPVPEDEDPIFWMPPADILQAYQEADLIVLNGAGFAKWVERASLPSSRVVDTAAPFAGEFIRYENATTHSHGKAGEHSHEGIDGHTWVDPVNAKTQAGEIRSALARLLPDHSADLEANFARLAADLDALDAGFREVSASDPRRPLLASHPAYNYLVRRYGWNLANLDLDPETMPTDAQFEEIRTILADHPAKFLLWESEPLPEIAARFRDGFGIESVTVSPCELLGEAEMAAGADYLTVMRKNLESLRTVFE